MESGVIAISTYNNCKILYQPLTATDNTDIAHSRMLALSVPIRWAYMLSELLCREETKLTAGMRGSFSLCTHAPSVLPSGEEPLSIVPTPYQGLLLSFAIMEEDPAPAPDPVVPPSPPSLPIPAAELSATIGPDSAAAMALPSTGWREKPSRNIIS
ncbi:hypothetical protein UY3_02050 [Chelonia mydas]|uniref:Uncharacterized protein n=1 Tax=Chelonia mydas TaxID=8469 RepID=M7C808_CHEMY|nr:hypothetical protein UY3_02050 [Chelonia mydas]